ncbi:hypothetical protein BDZ94DRAFT_1273237 [Collybia nuda]|uniref:Uncharacterized protein n=1 Tax=Collybia nuda TaxID=64659 RepID=A0A9P6CCS6_9AGAR|nr:hypothetical protein BDZ94DRAFT_1273237 [Collybia nuda]
MNRFKAAVVLSQIGLGELLDLDPGERIEMFGRLIGPQSIMAFNEEIKQRLGAFEGYDQEQDNHTPVSY